MIKNLDTVFFHELGHFVANKLIFELHNIFEIEKVLLLKKTTYELDFEGQTIKKTSEKDKNVPLINLPEKLCSLIYGCYFQCLYLGDDLISCFDSDSYCKGRKDYLDFAEGLRMFEINNQAKKNLWEYLSVEYFESLKEYRGLSKSFFKLDLNDFLIEKTIGYEVDIVELENHINPYLKEHKAMLDGCIKRIKEIINWEQVKSH